MTSAVPTRSDPASADARPAAAISADASMPGRAANRRQRAATILLAALLLLGVTATGWRIVRQYQPPGPFDPSRQGYCDFHNGIYFPSLAWIRGESPYGQAYADRYPVARQIPFFSPVILMLHAPLSALPLRAAEVTYFLLSLAAVGAIAWLSVRAASERTDNATGGDEPLRCRSSTAAPAAHLPTTLAVLAVATGIVYSRGGHITLFDGYFTLLLVLATIAAVHWADRRPWVAAAALVIASAKPTYILPLGILMLARGNFRAVLIGGVFSAALAGVGFGWLAYHEGQGDIGRGLTELRSQIATTQDIHRSQTDESPVYSWTRLDLFAVIAKWTGSDPGDVAHLAVMLLLLIAPCGMLASRRQAGRDDGVAGLSGLILLTAMLVSLYHQSYDALVLAAPLVGLVIGQKAAWRAAGRGTCLLLAGLLLIPAYNYLSTQMVLSRIDVGPLGHRLLTSVSAVALATALLLGLLLAWRQRCTARAPAPAADSV